MFFLSLCMCLEHTSILCNTMVKGYHHFVVIRPCELVDVCMFLVEYLISPILDVPLMV